MPPNHAQFRCFCDYAHSYATFIYTDDQIHVHIHSPRVHVHVYSVCVRMYIYLRLTPANTCWHLGRSVYRNFRTPSSRSLSWVKRDSGGCAAGAFSATL